MEQYDLRLSRGRKPSFDDVSDAHRRHAHGVDYVAIRGLKGGDLYCTREGWAMAESLLPRYWHDDQRFRQIGRALPGATGSVYRVPVPHAARGTVGIVVKFCRFGQDVGITAIGGDSHFPWSANLIASAEFLGPFEEFGAIHRLRTLVRAGQGSRIGTKRPLAIYAPATLHPAWQLGRDDYRLGVQSRALASDQLAQPPDRRLVYDPERIYVLLYSWVDGIDAEEAARTGIISNETMIALGRTAAEAVAAHGFAVLDHKPRHVIVRPRGHGQLLSRHGEPVFALIDYELLVPFSSPDSVLAV
jgi:hypothetical protein